MRLSVLFFGTDEQAQPAASYELLRRIAGVADAGVFEAVWVPERHFQGFGGLFPSPAVLAASLAASTERVSIRAGSVVLPLHDPIRVAEEWALVDNLSQGRVGVSFATGWHASDFVLAPDAYEDRREVTLAGIDLVHRLWRGEELALPGPAGATIPVTLHPRPVQPELPTWLTTSGSRETWRTAGARGFNLLAAAIGTTSEQRRERIDLYRRARLEAGHPGRGTVTMMLHTYADASEGRVRETVDAPLRRYVASYVRQAAGARNGPAADALGRLSSADVDALTTFALDRYLSDGSLLGTADKCQHVVDVFEDDGVDEIACLVDFGLPSDDVVRSLELVARLDLDPRRLDDRIAPEVVS